MEDRYLKLQDIESLKMQYINRHNMTYRVALYFPNFINEWYMCHITRRVDKAICTYLKSLPENKDVNYFVEVVSGHGSVDDFEVSYLYIGGEFKLDEKNLYKAVKRFIAGYFVNFDMDAFVEWRREGWDNFARCSFCSAEPMVKVCRDGGDLVARLQLVESIA